MPLTCRYTEAVEALLDVMQKSVSEKSGSAYVLADAARAQSDLEAARTTGSLLLIP